MGTMYNEDLVLPFAPPQWDDESMVILENQLGIGWKRGSFDARAVWETQFWLNDTIADDFPGIGTNITFSGLALRAGWTY